MQKSGTCEFCGKRCPCRAVADAQERFEKQPDPVRQAIKHAVSAWYFYGPKDGENSKPWTALFRVVNEFDEKLAELMRDDSSAAYRVVDQEGEAE